MPAPRNVISSSADVLARARSSRWPYTSCSGMPAGMSSPRPRRTPSGIEANSSSTDPTPMASSIACRSSGVTAVYVLKSGESRLVGGGVHEAFRLGDVRELHLDHPPLTIGVVVDGLGLAAEGRVDLDDLARERRDDVRDRLDGLDLRVGVVLRDRRSHLGRI